MITQTVRALTFSMAVSLAATPAALLIAGPAAAQSETSDYIRPSVEIVEAAAKAVTTLSERNGFSQFAKEAQAIVIFPDVIKAGFLISGSAGTGVIVKRQADGQWSAPAFYLLESAGLGLQAGIEVNTIGMLIMKKAALTPFYSGGIDLGTNANFTVASFSRTVDTESTPDIVTFTASKGAFAGISVRGSNFRPVVDRNAEFYGKQMNTQQVNDAKDLTAPGVEALKAALAAL